MDNQKNNLYKCDCNVIHENIVNTVKDKMPPTKNFTELSSLFKVFGDTTRIKILWALTESEMCVCDLSALLGVSQSAISHQLRTLRAARLVKNRRDGKVIYYSLNDHHIKNIFDEGMHHINE